MKTVFDHGTIITPSFLNSINTPRFSADPQNDGEIPLPPLSLMSDVQSAIAAEAARADAAESDISSRLPKCIVLSLTDLVNQWEIVNSIDVWRSALATTLYDSNGQAILLDLDFNWYSNQSAPGSGVRGVSFLSAGNSVSSVLFDLISSLFGRTDWGINIVYGTAHLNGESGFVPLHPLECVLMRQGDSSSLLRLQIGGVASDRPAATEIYRWGKIHLRVPLRGAFGT